MNHKIPKELTHEEIRDILPHRYPFLLLDRVSNLEEGKSIRAHKLISANEPHFQGHFPQKRVFPGVLIIEAMAQAAGVLGLMSNRELKDGVIMLVGVDEARFRRQVLPGDEMVMNVVLESVKRSVFARFQCHAEVRGEPVAEVKILCCHQKV